MRAYCFLLLVFLPVYFSCGPAKKRPLDVYDHYVKSPGHHTAFACVATYASFCRSNGLPENGRNREWVQRLRSLTARRFNRAYHDFIMQYPALKKTGRLIVDSSFMQQQSIHIRIRTGGERKELVIDSCRFDKSGKLLPSRWHFRLH